MCARPRCARAQLPDRPPRGGESRAAAPVRSMTVDGIPGSSPPSIAAATPARIRRAHRRVGVDLGRPRGSRSSRRRLRAGRRSPRQARRARGPGRRSSRAGPPRASRSGRAGLGTHERDTGRGAVRARSWPGGRRARGCTRAARRRSREERRRLDLAPPFEPIQVGGGLLVERRADETVDGVRRERRRALRRESHERRLSTSLTAFFPRRPGRYRADPA